MTLEDFADSILRATSRTFYLSIVELPPGLKEAVMSAYLSLRAIDEIEDHPTLDRSIKTELLLDIGSCHKPSNLGTSRLSAKFAAHRDELPEVTIHLDQWLDLAPRAVASHIRNANVAMARRMAWWVGKDWRIRTREDLDSYTFAVAGAVGSLLSDLWFWYDGTRSCHEDAIAFGRGLQAVNILRNRPEDLARGVDFFPDGWTADALQTYARDNLLRADAYVEALTPGPAKEFCRPPLALAYATLDALARGESKLSRNVVLQLFARKDVPLHVEVPTWEFPSTKRIDKGSVSSKRDQSAERSLAPLLRSGFDEEETFGKKEEVILVNEHDEIIGVEEKIKTHLLGALHRAFSIFIFNSRGQLLLQKRTNTKYHSKGLWSNTCCGHPRPGETIEQASSRRLNEEMGISSRLTKLFDFVYRAELEDGLIEHEYDHVLIGEFSGTPNPSKEEVEDWKWLDLTTLRRDVQENPGKHTYWFRIALDMLVPSLESAQSSHMSSAARS